MIRLLTYRIVFGNPSCELNWLNWEIGIGKYIDDIQYLFLQINIITKKYISSANTFSPHFDVEQFGVGINFRPLQANKQTRTFAGDNYPCE